MPKIGIDQIILSENIRKNYADIDDLADSIKKRGQLQPVILKKADPDSNGDPRYELVAGFRRYRAIQLLNVSGQGNTQIDAVVVTGDRLTINLIENLQRSELTAREREEGIALMVESGLSQKEVAAELSKNPDYVSRHIKAYKIRKIAEEAKIDTSDLETFTLTEIAAANDKDIPMLLGYIKNGGSTKEAARKIMLDYRGNKTQKVVHFEEPDSSAYKPQEAEETETESATERNSDIDPLAGVETEEEPEKAHPQRKEPISRENTNPDHLIVDLQFVFDRIFFYLDRLKKKIAVAGAESDEGIIAQHKIDAAYDIIAELHQVEKEK